jgi:hypothetical protein
MIDLVIGLFWFSLIIGLYILIAIIFLRYFGVNIMFTTSHRQAKKINGERLNTKLSVDKFASENPLIYKEIIERLKKKRYAKTYENLDFLICGYIKRNPTWADRDYEIALSNYREKVEKSKNQLEIRKIIDKTQRRLHLIENGFSITDAFRISEDLEFDYNEFTVMGFEPKKKQYP